jgi:hypothetical protein
MSSMYNLRPKATHFMWLFAHLNIGLHYSYTNAAMWRWRTLLMICTNPPPGSGLPAI